MSGPNTGTELHLDPEFAQSWNTLVSGHKMWALLPPDTEHRLLECDPKCSGHDKVICIQGVPKNVPMFGRSSLQSGTNYSSYKVWERSGYNL